MKDNSYSMSNLFLKLNDMLWKKSYLQNLRVLFYYIDWFLLLFVKKPKKVNREDSKKKVLVIFNLALGDGIMFLEAARSITKVYPKEKYHITFTCQNAFVKLYENENIFDEILPIDFASSIVNIKKRRAMFKSIREKYYDIVLDPVGCESFTTNIFIARAAVSEQKIGICDMNLPVTKTPNWMKKHIYTQVIPIHKSNIHMVEYYIEFINRIKNSNILPKPAELKETTLSLDLPEQYFIIFPTASMPVKRWSVKNYASLAKYIYNRTGWKLVICGTSHDRNEVEKMVQLIPEVPIVDVIGKTNILEFIEVIRNAKLVVTNDTSAYHISVAAKTPVAMICGGYTYDRYARYHYENAGFPDPVLVVNKMPCFNCNNSCVYQNINVYPCIDNITVENAVCAINELIDKEVCVHEP